MATGFNLIYGNDADALVDRLAVRLRASVPVASLLQPQIVLVPQFGLRRWLEIRLAEKLGIIANVAFYAPAEYAWILLRAAHPQLSETSLFDRNLLRWRIFGALQDLVREATYPELYSALANGEQSTRAGLADELAQMFERYLAYRSDMLLRWERGENKDDWQAELWRRLTRDVAEPHRARLLADTIQRYQHSKTPPPGLPPRLFAFACTNISPDLLRFYAATALHCALDFLMPNPCREYWGDVRTERQLLRGSEEVDFFDMENPLLAAYASAGREFIEQLFSYDLVQPQHETDLSRESLRDTLLHHMQADVLDRQAPGVVAEFPQKDNSIQFHICHSRLREVQVLHDQLLDLFAHDESLLPRDVAIMAPDIAAYAPYIHAVFGGVARDSARYLPYGVSDASAHDTHPLIAFALKLLALPLSRMGLAEIMELLALPAALRKLDLDAAQFDRLLSWLHDVGVRWGVDEAQHEAFGAGRYREFSWDFGLDRLLLGYASGEGDALIAGIAPSPAIEGSAAQILGALMRALDSLKALLRAQREAHTPRQWQQIFSAALEALLDVDGDDRAEARALQSIRDALAALAEDTTDAGLTEPLDWQCVRDFLSERLAEPERSYRFFSGGINVCGMLPLRVVPFRVICLIGMSEDAFPRRDRISALDRLQAGASARRLLGDRSDRDDDRYLFLQLLSAARDVFYLSWVGEEQRDGTAREPSAVVAELLDVASKHYFSDEKKTRAALIVEHPLQPFSPRHFDGSDARVFTYREQWRRAAASAVGAQALSIFVDTVLSQTASEQETQQVSLDELHHFWRNPARHFFGTRLGLHLPRQEDEIDDSDPLQSDGLMRYQLIEALVQKQLASPIEPNDPDFWRAQALLPVGRGGVAALTRARMPAQALAGAVRDLNADGQVSPPQAFVISFDAGARLIGSLPEHRDGLICRWSAGAVGGARLLCAWIDYLVLAAEHPRARLILLAWDKDKQTIQAHHLRGVDSAQARQYLRDLLQFYATGQCRPLLFFPKTSQAYIEALRKATSANFTALPVVIDADALEHARNTFETHIYGLDAPAECDDAAYALARRGLNIFDVESSAAEDFVQIAYTVYAPLFGALESAA